MICSVFALRQLTHKLLTMKIITSSIFSIIGINSVPIPNPYGWMPQPINYNYWPTNYHQNPFYTGNQHPWNYITNKSWDFYSPEKPLYETDKAYGFHGWSKFQPGTYDPEGATFVMDLTNPDKPRTGEVVCGPGKKYLGGECVDADVN